MNSAGLFVYNNSHKTLEVFNAYSIIDFPMTSCGCFECIACVLPSTNGVMVVYREFPDMTPVGMKFSTLAGSVGGGAQTPGFIGHSKQYIGSKKFLLAEGGAQRIVWMNAQLKEEMAPVLERIGEDSGTKNFLDMIADGQVEMEGQLGLFHVQSGRIVPAGGVGPVEQEHGYSQGEQADCHQEPGA